MFSEANWPMFWLAICYAKHFFSYFNERIKGWLIHLLNENTTAHSYIPYTLYLIHYYGIYSLKWEWNLFWTWASPRSSQAAEWLVISRRGMCTLTPDARQPPSIPQPERCHPVNNSKNVCFGANAVTGLWLRSLKWRYFEKFLLKW